jgi:hypothetical protein
MTASESVPRCTAYSGVQWRANPIKHLRTATVRGVKPVAGPGRTGARGDEFWQVWNRWGGWD